MMTWSPTAAARPLLLQRQHELDELFSLLPAPAPEAVRGAWKGRLMALRGLDRLPRPLGALLYGALALPLNPWQGKYLDPAGGSNRWLHPRGLDFGRFRVSAATSPVDGLPVLWLDYDLPGNPAPLRHIRGEARQLDAGRLLARMNWQGRNGLTRVLYFTLETVDVRHGA